MALIETIEEVKTHIAVNLTTEIENLIPYIEEAETRFIRPILGDELYAELLEQFEAGGSSSGSGISNYDDLLKKVQRPLIYFAYCLYEPTGNIQISDSGFHIAVNENKKAAFEWQVNRVVNSWYDIAYTGIDNLLEYLEDNIEDYPQWSSSTAFTILKSNFIVRASDFNKYFDIHNSRRVFVTIKAIMTKIEDFEIANAIGSDLYAEIKAQLLETGSGSGSGAGISAANEILLPWIKNAVAHLSISRAATDKLIQINHDGVHVVNYASEVSKRAAVPEELTPLVAAAEKDGRAYLHKLRDYLNKSATEELYAAYYNSDLYEELEDDETTPNSLSNDSEKKSYRL